MTLWQSCGLAFGFLVYAVAWFGGGRPERFAAGVLVLISLLASQANAWYVGGFYPGFMVLDGASVLIFGWLSLRSDRWWPMVATAGFGLIVLGHLIRQIEPAALSHYAMVSAKIGLTYVTDLAVLLGVWERWLAGEPPAGRAAWAAAARRTRRAVPA